jgi:FkbM family methyltransferase
MLLEGTFETAERAFVDRFLQPGMTVLDVGAHHGFYAMLASRRVGPSGQVIAFEPSSRERKRLMTHLRLNRCTNVRVESFALTDKEGKAPLFVVEGTATGCNSLRPPAVAEPTTTEWVQTVRLDDYLRTHGTSRVDLVKVDVEGGELAALRGAAELLGRQPRPVLLCEAHDIRTGPWGYKAFEISAFLRESGYCLFAPQAEGNLTPVDANCGSLEGNVVAVPLEQLEAVSRSSG